jgi:hypothetical protein
MTDTPPISQRLLQLAEAVLAKSRAGNIAWSEASRYAYYVPIGNYFLQIQSEDGDDSHPFRVHIEDDEANVLATLSTRDEPFGEQTMDWVNILADLYTEARRKGSSVERALDEMLEVVKQTPSQPKPDEDIPF